MTKAFEFLPIPVRSKKPRQYGLTMVLDQGLGLNYTEDLLAISADYIDLWKLGWATAQLQTLKIVKSKVDLLRSNNISVCNGGTLLELSEHQGHAEQLFVELRELGCDATEISSGSLDITPERVCELITAARGEGLRAFCEVGKKLPEKDLHAQEYNQQLKMFLSAGAEKVIIEARESGAKVGLMDDEGRPQKELMSIMLDGIDPKQVLFEAPRKSQQVFFLKEFGPETNLGNIHSTDVISVETLRLGMRGDTLDDFYSVIGKRHLSKRGE